ncbi:MAG: hypothetical protein WC803_01380 [Sphingomonas sp.]
MDKRIAGEKLHKINIMIKKDAAHRSGRKEKTQFAQNYSAGVKPFAEPPRNRCCPNPSQDTPDAATTPLGCI